MLHIIIGTKAQFIKMVPVMKGLEARGIPYNFINLGQHGDTVKSLSAQFQVSGIMCQSSDGKDVVSLPGMLKWAVGHLMDIAFRPNFLKEKIFKGQSGVALVHGDTLSTLLGLLMAKRAGLKIAHVESGLRSRNYLNPFPEELIRVICMRHSDYLFAPSDEAAENLEKMGVKGKVFNTHGNTGADAVRMLFEKSEVRSQKSEAGTYGHRPLKPFILVSIHRFENLYSRERFRFILDTIDEVSRRFNVIFVMHGPTERRLNKAGVSTLQGIKSQESGDVRYLPLQDYASFLRFIKDAEFVITDGGSVQEECYYLGKPCLIMRKRSERSDGIGKNAVVSGFDDGLIGEFIGHYKSYERPESSAEIKPTTVLINELLMLNGAVSSVSSVATR